MGVSKFKVVVERSAALPMFLAGSTWWGGVDGGISHANSELNSFFTSSNKYVLIGVLNKLSDNTQSFAVFQISCHDEASCHHRSLQTAKLLSQ